MTPEEVALLFNYSAWELDRAWECVEGLTDNQFVQEIEYLR
jgi:hypothetical protein